MKQYEFAEMKGYFKTLSLKIQTFQYLFCEVRRILEITQSSVADNLHPVELG